MQHTRTLFLSALSATALLTFGAGAQAADKITIMVGGYEK